MMNLKNDLNFEKRIEFKIETGFSGTNAEREYTAYRFGIDNLRNK